MKVISFYPGVYPDGHAPMSFRLHYYMKALKSKGVDVSIAIPSNNPEIQGHFDGIPYFNILATPLTRFNKRKVIGEYATICKKLATECDVLFTVCWGNTHLIKTANSVHEVGGKIAIEINENPYSIFSGRRDTKFNLYLRRLLFLNINIKKADGIIVISNPLLELISKYKRDNSVITKVPILTGFKSISRVTNYDGIPYILHAGAISEQKDGIKAMLNAFLIAHKKLNGNLKFVFTYNKGYPKLMKWIKRFIKDNNLENYIEFKSILPNEKLNELYSNCALCIVNKPLNEQNKYNFPTKLTEILPRQIPLIVSNTGELSFHFLNEVNAYVVYPNKINQIAEYIISIILNPEKAKGIAISGRKLAEDNFFYLNHADNIYNFFKNVNLVEK